MAPCGTRTQVKAFKILVENETWEKAKLAITLLHGISLKSQDGTMS